MDIPQTTYGIQALIERLRSEGIDAGRREAAQLIEQARQEIERLRSAVGQEADLLLARAREQARIEQEASLAAVRLAFRDSALRLREDFLHQFGERLKRRVRDELADNTLLSRVLQTLLTQGAAGSTGTTETGRDWQGELDALAQDTSARMLADGIELVADRGHAGLRLRLSERDLEVDFTDEAITELLLEHLLPRVRRLLDGGPLAPVEPSIVPAPAVAPADAELDDRRPRAPA